MANVSKECNLGIHYLSPMHISDSIIKGYDLPPTHPDMVKLMAQKRDQVNKQRREKYKLAVARYIHGAMRKIKGNGCLVAAHHIG